jgi:metal-responsive CopG/Arc/MetJ family transcriptional regulator
MTNAKELLSEEMIQQIEEAARTENRKPAEVLQDAVKQYLERRSWMEFVSRNEQRAREMGLKEEDVPRLVEEYRRENREHSR